MVLKIRVKVGTSESCVELDEAATIGDLRAHFTQTHNAAPADVKLICKGKILKFDDDRIADTIASNVVYVNVKTSPNSTPNAPSTTSASAPKTAQASPDVRQSKYESGASATRTAAAPPAGGMFDPSLMAQLMGQNGQMGLDANSMRQMQERLQQNPELMQQMLASPLMQSMLRDPETMRAIINQNPQMRDVMEKNPQIAEVLNDPELMQQIMQTQSSKSASDQMSFQQEHALRQIENLGGFNQIERMYNQVAGAMDGVGDDLANSFQPPSGGQSQAQHNLDPSTAPNPWSTGPAVANSNAPSAPLNFGAANNLTTLPPGLVANLMGTAKGRAKSEGLTRDSLATFIATNAEYVRFVAVLSGCFARLAAAHIDFCRSHFSPFVADSPMYALLSNMGVSEIATGAAKTTFEDVLHRPAVIRALADLTQLVASICRFDRHFFEIYFMTANDAHTSPFAAACRKALAENNTLDAPHLRPSAAITPQNAPPVVTNPEEAYKTQIDQIYAMGITNDRATIANALQRTRGNVSAAVDLLFSMQK